MRHIARCTVVVAALLAGPAFGQAFTNELSPAAQIEMYRDAVTAFSAHHYSAAYGRFMRLADAGHEPSAQMALAMYRNGQALFGAEWDATEQQLTKWSTLVVTAERENADPRTLRVSLR